MAMGDTIRVSVRNALNGDEMLPMTAFPRRGLADAVREALGYRPTGTFKLLTEDNQELQDDYKPPDVEELSLLACFTLSMTPGAKQALLTHLRSANGARLAFAYGELSQAAREDRDILLLVLERWTACYGRTMNVLPFGIATTTARNSEALVMDAVKINGGCLEYAGQKCKDNKAIVLMAIEQDPHLLHFAGEACKSDEELVLKAWEKDASCLEHAGDLFKNNKTMMRKAVDKAPLCLKSAGESCKIDEEVVMMAVQKDASCLQYAGELCKNNKAIVFTAVKQAPHCLMYAGDDLKKELAIAILTVKKYPGVLEHLDHLSKSNGDALLDAISKHEFAMNNVHLHGQLHADRHALRRVAESIKTALDVVSVATAGDIYALNCIDSFCQIHRCAVLAGLEELLHPDEKLHQSLADQDALPAGLEELMHLDQDLHESRPDIGECSD